MEYYAEKDTSKSIEYKFAKISNKNVQMQGNNDSDIIEPNRTE